MRFLHALHQITLGERNGEGGGKSAIVAFRQKHAQVPISEREEIVEISADGFGRNARRGDVKARERWHFFGKQTELCFACRRDLGFERLSFGNVLRVEW